MAHTLDRIGDVVLNKLAGSEMRLLGLVVAVRRSLAAGENIKGDLSAMVKASLGRMIAAKAVVDHDGVYTLTPIGKARLPAPVPKGRPAVHAVQSHAV